MRTESMMMDRLTMNRISALCLAAALATAPVAHAQSRPDLSGTWLPERSPEAPAPEAPSSAHPPSSVHSPTPAPPPGLPPPPPPPKVISLRIVQSGDELRVERTMAVGAEKAAYTFTFNLSGGENTNHMGPIASKSTANWREELLTITSTYFINGKQVGNGVETYALRDGKLIIEEQRVVPAGPFSARQVYSRGS
jgi:hypothetical protein